LREAIAPCGDSSINLYSGYRETISHNFNNTYAGGLLDSLASRWDSLNIRPRVGWVEARNPTPAWVTLSLTHPTLHFTYLLTGTCFLARRPVMPLAQRRRNWVFSHTVPLL